MRILGEMYSDNGTVAKIPLLGGKLLRSKEAGYKTLFKKIKAHVERKSSKSGFTVEVIKTSNFNFEVKTNDQKELINLIMKSLFKKGRINEPSLDSTYLLSHFLACEEIDFVLRIDEVKDEE